MQKPLSDLEQIKASEELKKQTLAYVMEKKKGFPMFAKAVILTTCIACFIFAIFTLTPNDEESMIPDPVYAYVTFDINPSMELRLDQSHTVIETKAYNKDGEALLSQLNLTNHTLADSVDMMIQHPSFQAYMEEGYLQVSVYSDDTKTSRELETLLDQTLADHYNEDQYGCSCASKHDHEMAGTHHISLGRYQMIEDIIAIDTTYTVNDLEQKTMRELKDLYQQLSGENKEQHHRAQHHEN